MSVSSITFINHHAVFISFPPANSDIPATFEEGSVNLLHGKLSNHLAANYHSFGIQLGFTLVEIGAFAKHKVPVKDKLESMLNEWVLANKPLSDVYTALESGAVDRNRLAKDLREEWSNYTSKLQSIIIFLSLSF